MSKEDFHTEKEIADFLNWEVSTLRKERYTSKDHPPFIKIKNCVLYPRKEFKEWVESHLICQSGART